MGEYLDYNVGFIEKNKKPENFIDRKLFQLGRWCDRNLGSSRNSDLLSMEM